MSFSFESEEVTGFCYSEGRGTDVIMLIKFIKKNCFSYQIRNGMGSAAAHQKVLYEQF
jgi:hypothetical protein